MDAVALEAGRRALSLSRARDLLGWSVSFMRIVRYANIADIEQSRWSKASLSRSGAIGL